MPLLKRSVAAPFFTASWLEQRPLGDHPGGAGRGGIRCPDDLLRILAKNDLVPVDCVTDGNCGVDAFLQTCLTHPELTDLRSEPWVSLRRKSKSGSRLQLFAYARKLAGYGHSLANDHDDCIPTRTSYNMSWIWPRSLT